MNMGRRKSAKKADFQKVKLKVGHSLPKGLNVTNTKFKTKKIKVPAQFRPPTSDPKAEHLKNIEELKELMKKAQHSSVNARSNAFLEMCKFLNSHKEFLEIFLSEVLEVSSIGLRDYSSSVRTEAINVCCLILENVPEMKISALSSRFLPHLCCAMSSIHHDIRTDSLRVLELCLHVIPSVITSSEKILKNFVTQISVDRSQAMYVNSGFRVSSMSTKSASKHVKSHHWRAKVLCMLAKFLKAVIDRLSKKQEGYFWPTFYSPIKIPGMGPKLPEFSNLKSYFASIMSILFDIWIEAVPMPHSKSDSGEIVSAKAAEVMDIVIQVIRLMCEWIKIVDEEKKNKQMLNWFNTNFSKQIFGRLMVWFPYSQRAPVRKREQFVSMEMSCLTVNLALCDVFSMMMPPSTNSIGSKLYQQVKDYLLHVINRDNSGGVASVSIIIKIVKNLLVSSKLENFKPHLIGLLKLYKKLEVGGKDRLAILNFIIDLIFDIGSGNVEFIGNMPVMKYLVQSLLRDLFRMHQNNIVEEEILSVIKKLNAIGFLPFVTELQENSVIVIELIKSEKVEIQKTAVCLISRLTHISMDYFCELAKTIFDFVVPVKTVDSLTGALSYGLKHPLRDPVFTGKDYANFLFCLAIGMFRREAHTYISLAQSEQDKYRDVVPFNLTKYSIVPSTALHYHFEITQVAVRALMSYSDRKQMSKCIHAHLRKFNTECTSFPAHTAIALLLLQCEAYKVGCPPDDADCLLCVTELTIACFLYQDAWERGQEPEEIKLGSLIGALLSVVKVLKNMKYVLEVITQRITGLTNMEQVQCIGRLMLVALRKDLVPREDLATLTGVMCKLKEFCGNEVQYEPWWLAICWELHGHPASVSNC